LSDPQNLKNLLDKSVDTDGVVRGQAADQLGALGGSQAIDALKALLTDSDVIVRFKAASSLAYLGQDDGSQVLLWALGRLELSFAALEAMTELASQQTVAGLKSFFKRWNLHPLERLQTAAALHRCGEAAGTLHLQACLDSKKPEERGFAIELWGRLKMPGALDMLQGILSDSRAEHRMDAVRGLLHLRDERCQILLKRIAREKDDEALAELANEALKIFDETDRE
jgi:HEAT repeat protein